MNLSADLFLEAVADAREYLRTPPIHMTPLHTQQRAQAFAEVIVHVARTCLVGVACAKHSGVIHGQEAEELRRGIEMLCADNDIKNTTRAQLLSLLDAVDARDSLSFRETQVKAQPNFSAL